MDNRPQHSSDTLATPETLDENMSSMDSTKAQPSTTGHVKKVNSHHNLQNFDDPNKLETYHNDFGKQLYFEFEKPHKTNVPLKGNLVVNYRNF